MKFLLPVLCVLFLSACATSQTQPYDYESRSPDMDTEPVPAVIAQPDPTPPPAPITPPAPPRPEPLPPVIEIYEEFSLYDVLPYWSEADHQPALSAFNKSCASFEKADPAEMLNPNLPQYGQYIDWSAACQIAAYVPEGKEHARIFFESEFIPVALSTPEETEGLLTGYYEPELSVRKVANSTYSEPILARPKSEAVMSWPRSKIKATSSRVIAYGKPIDVFFMQIQGSGRLKFSDGRVMRASYAGNNGYSYTSIGKVLVEQGELSVDQSSKRAIEKWMKQAGPKKARALMNKNKRYIFFREQAISAGDGPTGAMRVPLVKMGSIAIDPSYHPYGTLVWLNTKLPAKARDYVGYDTGILVNAQDTGNAIRGPLRADLFFGPGKDAGALAGVMKHPVAWTILLPAALALRQAPVS